MRAKHEKAFLFPAAGALRLVNLVETRESQFLNFILKIENFSRGIFFQNA